MVIRWASWSVQSDIVYEGNYAAWVGTVDAVGEDDYNDFTGESGTEGYTNNWIAQTVNVAGMASLDLWYNFFTWDGGDFDNPGFEIQVNGISVLSISASTLNPEEDEILTSTDWQIFSYDLTGYTNSTLDLTIYAGNTVDSTYQSWAYIDNSTAPVPEPATMLLFGTGLVGLVGSRLRKKKQK